MISAVAALVLATGAGVRDAADDWIGRTVLPVTLTETSTEIRDRNGVLLRAYQIGSGIWRLKVSPDQVDPQYLKMLVRYEDKRFWRHNGVDPIAFARAALQAMWNGRAISGGSTLTMQVARLLEDGSTGRWSGKLRQVRVALALERRFSKSQILDLYLTHAPFGANLEGVRAAALAWFGQEPRRLTPSQAALLVALPQAPEARRPDKHAAAARAARDRVVLRSVHQGILDAGQADVALRAPVPENQRPFPMLAAHVGDRLRAQDPAAGRIDVTLDARVQRSLERVARDAALRAGARISAALVVADHTSGEILASVGSSGYGRQNGRDGFVDMTRAIRSPGSLLKPLIYGLAFDQGLAHPETVIHDGPVRFGQYAPQNFDGQFRGDILIKDALRQSLNIPVVKLTEKLGPARVTAGLRRSGAALHIPGGKPGLAISLGGLGVSLHDLVQLYAALANGGQSRRLRLQHGIETAGQPRLISPEAAWQLGHILSGLTPPAGAPSGVLAYKTGTSYGHRDAWAIGYDGTHTIGVWMGRPDGTPVPGAFGGDLAAPVLFEAFGLLKPGFDRLPPPPPATLIVSSADLPQPLRRFRSDSGPADTRNDDVAVAFPPDGARLANDAAPVTVKIRGGTAPFSVLANGQPVVTGAFLREFPVANPGNGYSTLVVVDRNGKSDRVTVRLD